MRIRRLPSLAIGSLVLGLAFSGVSPVQAASNPVCSSTECTLAWNSTILDDDRLSVVARAFNSTGRQHFGGTITDYEKDTDDCYKNHNHWVQFAQRSVSPDFFDRDPGFSTSGGATFGISLSGPSVSWQGGNPTNEKWQIVKDSRWTDPDWGFIMYHNLFSHGQWGSWDKDSFGLAVYGADTSRSLWVYMRSAVQAGSNCWDPPWKDVNTGWICLRACPGAPGGEGEPEDSLVPILSLAGLDAFVVDPVADAISMLDDPPPS